MVRRIGAIASQTCGCACCGSPPTVRRVSAQHGQSTIEYLALVLLAVALLAAGALGGDARADGPADAPADAPVSPVPAAETAEAG